MKVFTIGFTKISAARFFELLRESGAERVVDIRLNNVNRSWPGFSKKPDLQFFLREICGMDYVHLPTLAPSKEVFDGLKKHHKNWDRYEREFLALMRERRIEEIPHPGRPWTTHASSAPRTPPNTATDALSLNTSSVTGAIWKSCTSSASPFTSNR